jgi:divalent metal cation (Fe/Co/Zn/Cd) transporter
MMFMFGSLMLYFFMLTTGLTSIAEFHGYLFKSVAGFSMLILIDAILTVLLKLMILEQAIDATPLK